MAKKIIGKESMRLMEDAAKHGKTSTQILVYEDGVKSLENQGVSVSRKNKDINKGAKNPVKVDVSWDDAENGGSAMQLMNKVQRYRRKKNGAKSRSEIKKKRRESYKSKFISNITEEIIENIAEEKMSEFAEYEDFIKKYSDDTSFDDEENICGDYTKDIMTATYYLNDTLFYNELLSEYMADMEF